MKDINFLTNCFEERYKSLFVFASTVGWDGHYAAAVTPEIKANALKIWLDYDLYNKPHDLVLSASGNVSYEITTVHGWLDIYVELESYTAGITTDDGLVVMPDIRRNF